MMKTVALNGLEILISKYKYFFNHLLPIAQ